ncbi:MAG: glycoside hydrolase family 27 protein [Chitinophagaceae bacterium]
MNKNFLIIALILTFAGNAQKWDGLALTPPMGWNSWNTFQGNINEKLVIETADAMVSSGMKDAGYVYLVLDDAWMAKERDSKTGDLVADPVKFPGGMKSVADYVHSKGLKFGLYNCAGTLTCAGYPGTRGYEYQDARFYASVGIDYLKFDWCSSDGINAREAYTTMSKALKLAGRPILFSLCEWGQNKPWTWAAPVGHIWRTTGDITAQFEGVRSHGTWSSSGVMRILESQDTLREYAGPGHWNDPDMLEVGNGLSQSEDRAHFSMWSMIAAPLIAGNDIRKMSSVTNAILINKEVIAINQDSLGIQAMKYAAFDSVETWIKPLKNGDWAICFLNRKNTPQPLPVDWMFGPIDDPVAKRTLDIKTTGYKIHDIWEKKDVGTTKKLSSLIIAPHDVVLLRLIK